MQSPHNRPMTPGQSNIPFCGARQHCTPALTPQPCLSSGSPPLLAVPSLCSPMWVWPHYPPPHTLATAGATFVTHKLLIDSQPPFDGASMLWPNFTPLARPDLAFAYLDVLTSSTPDRCPQLQPPGTTCNTLDHGMVTLFRTPAVLTALPSSGKLSLTPSLAPPSPCPCIPSGTPLLSPPHSPPFSRPSPSPAAGCTR